MKTMKKLTLTEFSNITELTDFLRANFSDDTVSLRCFMATDETYWKDNLSDEFFSAETTRRMQEFLQKHEYSKTEFEEFLNFMNDFPFLESGNCREFYELELYFDDFICFVNPALCQIVIWQKNWLAKKIGTFGDIARIFWQYELKEDKWIAKKAEEELDIRLLFTKSLVGAVIPFALVFATPPGFVFVPLFALGIILSVQALRTANPRIKRDEAEEKETPSVQLCAIMAGSSFGPYVLCALMLFMTILIHRVPF